MDAIGEDETEPLLVSTASLKAPATAQNYNSLKAKAPPRQTNPTGYVKTYTAGEDAGRLALAAKELGLQRQRTARAQVRQIELDYDRVMDILASAQLPGESIPSQKKHLKAGETLAGVAGNILEWYDFAVFGYFGDIIGEVFFPPSGGHTATMESFAVFGGAFFARPLGGVLLGYIGDVYGRKVALTTSIFLMAFPTFFMGCLPSYNRVGYLSPILLILIRLAQGMSVGGQLMSSLVFTLENSPRGQWGLYGSFVWATGNMGTLLGGLVGYAIRANLSRDELVAFGWRIPFLAGVVVSLAGFYLNRDGEGHGHGHGDDNIPDGTDKDVEDPDGATTEPTKKPEKVNPLALVFEPKNLRPLLASATVPMLWSTGFYLSFVWMPIYMTTMAVTPVPHAFAVNSLALLFSVVLLFPIAGWLSDTLGRRMVMSIGGISVALLSPLVIRAIGESGHFGIALAAQVFLGVCLSFWGSPMCAWLVESFPPEARLTSMAVGYNVGLAIVGGLTPALATFMVDAVGPLSPGWIYSSVACIAMAGLWIIAPSMPPAPAIESTK